MEGGKQPETALSQRKITGASWVQLSRTSLSVMDFRKLLSCSEQRLIETTSVHAFKCVVHEVSRRRLGSQESLQDKRVGFNDRTMHRVSTMNSSDTNVEL